LARAPNWWKSHIVGEYLQFRFYSVTKQGAFSYASKRVTSPNKVTHMYEQNTSINIASHIQLVSL
jgi:predicted transcriptional regulator